MLYTTSIITARNAAPSKASIMANQARDGKQRVRFDPVESEPEPGAPIVGMTIGDSCGPAYRSGDPRCVMHACENA